MSVFALLALAILPAVLGDVYMHNPRGSNDRNCERNVNRDNGNRLFDSQNNNNGGYACPRGVGDETFQAEDGTATFNAVDTVTGDTVTFTQNKRIYYYAGSVLPIEWTNQHGCGGNSKVSCEIVLQYACEDTLDPRVDNFWPWTQNKAESTTKFYGKQHFRNGANIGAPRDGVPRDNNDAATETIPDNEASAIASTQETRRFGMQESYDHYQLCQRTERNKGLYTADQRVNRNDRRGTRQNPNGNRHGFECPEERDYYPWWAPSPWIDIAVLSDSAGSDICYPTSPYCSRRCQYYMNNTMNWNKKGYCDVAHVAGSSVQTKLTSQKWQTNQWYNNKAACETAGFTWYEVSHADNLNLGNNSFVCAKTQYARVNQLGNAMPGLVVSQSSPVSSGVVNSHVKDNLNANRFLWTIPQIPVSPKGADYFPDMSQAYKSCVLRIRYNISSADFPAWPVDAVNEGTPRMVDRLNNSNTPNDPRTPLHQDPYVFIGPGDSQSKGEMFVKLKVNTNQYGRTFQDRSFVFTIKPLPKASAAASNQADTPAIDYNEMKTRLSKGGKIYNLNVRGKRGNIVQTFPSVEYDFVPNALALGVNDMLHLQWTGSDYNPRRGCNDGMGGPPDLNTYSTEANANLNPRADRSNFVLTYHMGFNVPMDYLGYDPANSANLSYAEKQASARQTVLSHAPCFDPAKDSETVAQQCYDTLMRAAFLNQQSDAGSLVLRQGKKCLTTTELNAIKNQDVADYHPLNCAKMNAKPYPYFDTGLLFMRKQGWFPYYSSRNNNFSNRQQIGVLCVGDNCKVDNTTNVLQDKNPETNGNSLVNNIGSTCYDTATGSAGTANANAAHSCISATTGSGSATPTQLTILSAETFAVQEGDNDSKGDGNKHGCAVLTFNYNTNSVEQNIALAFILLAVGLFTSWLGYYLYNRYQARQAEESKFRHDTAWQSAVPLEKSKQTRPVSVAMGAGAGASVSESFSQENPGVKMGRPSPPPPRNVEMTQKTSAKGPPSPSPKPSSAKGGQKIKRTEMI